MCDILVLLQAMKKLKCCCVRRELWGWRFCCGLPGTFRANDPLTCRKDQSYKECLEIQIEIQIWDGDFQDDISSGKESDHISIPKVPHLPSPHLAPVSASGMLCRSSLCGVNAQQRMTCIKSVKSGDTAVFLLRCGPVYWTLFHFIGVHAEAEFFKFMLVHKWIMIGLVQKANYDNNILQCYCRQ